MFKIKELIPYLISIILLVVVFSVAISGESESVKDFTLPDYNGKPHSLSDYQDSKAIVVMFIATQCPVSNAYNERMASIYRDYSEKDVAFIGINSNKQESVEEISKHAEKNGLNFTILKDEKNIIADRFEAEVTPEIFVLSPEFKIIYHGRIDDSQRESEVKSQDLRNALNEILAGEKVSVSETKAFGCT
ncbi:MAG: thioredoxin family protein, partial [Calditrichaeota bacterium]